MTREEAIRELKIRFVGEYDRQREAKDMAIKALEQEPKTGRWIINKDKSLARCSNCKFLLKDKDEIELFGTFMQGYNYCPNCGAKMVKPDEGYANDWIGYSR